MPSNLHSAKGGAVETGCSDLNGVIYYFAILYYPNPLHPPPTDPPPTAPPVMNIHSNSNSNSNSKTVPSKGCGLQGVGER